MKRKIIFTIFTAFMLVGVLIAEAQKKTFPKPKFPPNPKVKMRLISPNGGEQWIKGRTYKIKWENYFVTGKMCILLKQQAGGLDFDIAMVNVTPGKGSYQWTIEDRFKPRSDYKVRLETPQLGDLYDDSDSFFTILPNVPKSKNYIKILSPKGGETLVKSKTYTIHWKGNRILMNPKIRIKNGTIIVKTYIPKVKAHSREGEWTWEWQVPNDIPNGNNYKVRVEDRGGAISGENRTPFTITAIIGPVPTNFSNSEKKGREEER